MRGNSTVEKAKSFQRYQLYYAGERVAGLPLTSVDRFYYPTGKYGPAVDSFSFTYGDCTPPPATEPYGESPTCMLPLDIGISPACIKPPSYVMWPRSWKPMRGAIGKHWPVGPSLQLWTGRVFVRISAHDARVIPEVVNRLVPLNRVERRARDRRLLPAPRLDSLKKSYCRWARR